jgi:formylglycine-generating enzyme required for sulfatase activity
VRVRLTCCLLLATPLLGAALARAGNVSAAFDSDGSGAPPHAQPPAAPWFQDCGACPVMVVIPAGTFVIGSPDDEPGRRSNEGPAVTVTLGAAFALGQFEVTFAEWDRCLEAGACPPADDAGWGRGRRPVINVGWQDAVGYAEWLSRVTGARYRLPSEAEWEYAARAGAVGPRLWRDDRFACDHANLYDLSARRVARYDWRNVECDDNFARTAPAGSYRPNAFGLHDMLGNVWEWVADCANDSYASMRADGRPVLFPDCRRHVYRGGSWNYGPRDVRLAKRATFYAISRYNNRGFRVARDLPLSAREKSVQGQRDALRQVLR